MTIIFDEGAYDSAIKRNILNNARQTWRANTERGGEIEFALGAGRVNGGYSEDFIGSLAKAFDSYGKLTEKQSAAVLKGIDARAARRAEWADKQAVIDAAREHIGAVGEKASLSLTIKKIIHMQGVAFSYRDSGVTTLYIMEDAQNNVVIYKGNSAAFDSAEEGQLITLSATIKAHGVRNGVKQTIIQRPKAV